MDIAILELLITGGPVALLAFIIFWMYMKEKRYTEKRIHAVHRAHSERLESLLEKDLATREKLTMALTELITLIVRLNGKGK